VHNGTKKTSLKYSNIDVHISIIVFKYSIVLLFRITDLLPRQLRELNSEASSRPLPSLEEIKKTNEELKRQLRELNG
jgi:hypothetical protein